MKELFIKKLCVEVDYIWEKLNEFYFFKSIYRDIFLQWPYIELRSVIFVFSMWSK